jgi:hypothetical protein
MSSRNRKRVRALQKRINALLENRETQQDGAEYYRLVEQVRAIHRKCWLKYHLRRMAAERDAAQPNLEHWEQYRRMMNRRKVTRWTGHSARETVAYLMKAFTENKVDNVEWHREARLNALSLQRGAEVPLTRLELHDALRKLPDGKAAGYDGIPHEAFKHMPERPLGSSF